MSDNKGYYRIGHTVFTPGCGCLMTDDGVIIWDDKCTIKEHEPDWKTKFVKAEEQIMHLQMEIKAYKKLILELWELLEDS